MSEGKKGQKLARFSLIPVKALWLLAEVYGRGAQKYADRNFEKGYAWDKSYDAIQRHLHQWWGGEQFDSLDGQHHLAAVMWHCAALIEWEDTHPENDTRSRKIALESELLNPEEIAEAKTEITASDVEDLRGWTGEGSPKVINDFKWNKIEGENSDNSSRR